MDQIKRVGEICPKCGTPYVAGKNGAYCKPCYIEWKNAQGGNAGQAFKAETPKIDWDKIGMKKAKTKIAEAYIRTSREFATWKEEADEVMAWIDDEEEKIPF